MTVLRDDEGRQRRAGRSTAPPDAEAALAAGREALTRGAWQDAKSAFSDALVAGESPEALEGLAWATYWLDDGPATLDARHAAYRLYRERGDTRDAARVATRLAEDYLSFRGDQAVSNGWLRRASRLLDGVELSPEHGWLALFAGHFALVLDGDTPLARAKGVEITTIGRTLGDTELEMLGLALEGLALVSEGNSTDGMARLDEASAAATGELASLEAVVWTNCYLIFACERIRDYGRAAQWCEVVKEFSQRFALDQCFSICRVHYAGILVWLGNWDEAERELAAATSHFQAKRPGYAGEGLARLGELRTHQGRLDEAAELFARAEGEPLAQVGHAGLTLELGDAAGAVALAERALRRLPAANRTDRVAPLEVLVRAHAELGHVDLARGPAEELAELAAEIGTDPMRATAQEAAGIVAAAAGEHEEARRRLEDAVDLFGRSGSGFHAGRARHALAATLLDLGRDAPAREEARAAHEALVAVGASSAAARAASLLARLEPKHVAGGLTRREVQVLRLIARGLGDREIAAELVLSEHTVHRHVSNILAKLGLPTRAAAVAHATKHELI